MAYKVKRATVGIDAKIDKQITQLSDPYGISKTKVMNSLAGDFIAKCNADPDYFFNYMREHAKANGKD